MKTLLSSAWKSLACSVALVSAAQALQTLDGSEKNLNEDVVNRFAIGLSVDVLDPSAAQFHSLSPSPSNMAGKFICGFANLKNVMGGYIGFKPFWFNLKDDKTFVFESYDQPNSMAYDFEMLTFKRSGCEFVLDLRE